MKYVSVMIGTTGEEYRTECETYEQASALAKSICNLGWVAWVEIEEG